MQENLNMQRLKKQGSGGPQFSPEILDWISAENLWNLWVPRSFGGLGYPLKKGLQKLQSLARVDGSLGWTVTLCSGANFFIGNLTPTVAEEIFLKPSLPVVLGGSGGVFGTAEKTDSGFVITGKWKYATGAPYLSHFTLNAFVTQNGRPVLDKEGSQVFKSFILPKKDVQVIEDWNTMGLEATATHSFDVQDIFIEGKYSFHYNEVHLPHSIFKINFSVFADLTLWVNYLGMAEHFLEESRSEKASTRLSMLHTEVRDSNAILMNLADEVEQKISTEDPISKNMVEGIHVQASSSVQRLTRAIIELYPFLGIKTSRKSHILNQIFRDYFTATQHHIFTRRA